MSLSGLRILEIHSYIHALTNLAEIKNFMLVSLMRFFYVLEKYCTKNRSLKCSRRAYYAPFAVLRYIFTSSLKPLNGIQQNLTGSKILTSSTKFVFYGPIGKTRWPPLPLIGWDIFDFSSKTAERNSTKLYRKQEYQRPLPHLCFSGRSQKQAGRPSLWLAETFLTSPLKPLNGIQQN